MGQKKYSLVQRKKHENIDINLINLIDVFLLLLIFFMVTTSFVEVETGVNIKLPSSKIKEVSANTEIIISLTKDKEIFVNSKKVSVDNFEAETAKEMEYNKKYNVIIRADKELDYGHVVKFMTMAKNAGATEIDIATEEEQTK